MVQLLSCVWCFATPWTLASQAPLSVGFPRQEYWSGLSFPCLGDLPDPGIEPASPTLAGGFLITGPLGKSCLPVFIILYHLNVSSGRQALCCHLAHHWIPTLPMESILSIFEWMNECPLSLCSQCSLMSLFFSWSQHAHLFQAFFICHATPWPQSNLFQAVLKIQHWVWLNLHRIQRGCLLRFLSMLEPKS